MAKILETAAPAQTATKTKVNALTIAGIAVMALTTTALLGFFSALAATSIWKRGQTPSDFGYEIHDLAAIGDYGTVYNLTHEWKRVEFLRADRGLKPYSEYLDAQGNTLPPPVVIAQPLSYKGVQPAHIRIKNVTNTGFDLKIEEWGYMDGVHAKEDVGFLVWPVFSLYDGIAGFAIEAGAIETTHNWSEIKLSLDFKNYLQGEEPVIFTQSQTYNGADPIVTRNKTVSDIPEFTPIASAACRDSDGGKNYYVKGITTSIDGYYYEDACLLTVITSQGSIDTKVNACSGPLCKLAEGYCTTNDAVSNIAYNCPIGCGLGACLSDKIYQARLQEEEAKGGHIAETIGYIAIKPFSGLFGGDRKVEVGTINSNNALWTLVPFRYNFDNSPLFLANMQTFNGADTAGLRYKDLDNLKAYIKVEEEQSKDAETGHVAETVGYIAISRPIQAVGKLEVSLAGEPAPQKVMAGAQNFTFANLILDATNSTADLQVNQVKVTISTGNGGFPANLSNSTLWDGGTQLTAANDPDSELSANTTPGGAANAVFILSSPLTIPIGASKTLTYKANISSAAVLGAEISGGIQPGAEPTVQDAGGNKVSPAISYSAGSKMTVHEAAYYYKFENNVLDSSGNEANATAFGNPTFVAGKTGQALQFDGVNDYAALPVNYRGNYDQISQLTACAWFYTSSISMSKNAYGNWPFVDFDRSEYFSFFINEATGQLGFATHSKSPEEIHDLYSQRPYLYGARWHFGCAVYDSGKKYFYLDGKLDYGQGNVSVQTFHSGAPLESALTRFGFIGDGSKAASFNGEEETKTDPADTGRSNFYYSGLIDELRIYEKALTEAEMKSLYLDCDPKYQALGLDPENLTYAQKQLLAEFPAIDTLTTDGINFIKAFDLNPNNLSVCDKIYLMEEAEVLFSDFLQFTK